MRISEFYKTLQAANAMASLFKRGYAPPYEDEKGAAGKRVKFYSDQ